MSFNLRTRRFGVTALGVTILGGAAAAALSTNPAVAAGIVTAVTTVTCSLTDENWCIGGHNTSSGIGVIGTSKTGTGLRGTSTSQYGLKATSVTGTAILAETTSGPAAISASAGSGGYGVSTTGGRVGVYAKSPGYALYGTSTTGFGVAGLTTTGIGAYGATLSGFGVQGSASTGTGGYFTSESGFGLVAYTGGTGPNVALLARNTGGNGSDITGSYIGLLGRSPKSGFPLVLTDTSANDLFYVDGEGNVSYKGGLYHFAHTAGGATVRSFSPNTTLPTVEDTGTAQLNAGVAAVRLDPTFAAAIDPTTAYRVFVTPNGDTKGLFVATKTAAGFVVRESQAGRSTVTFDYRIVATALGQAGQRMAVVNGAAAGSGPQAPPAAVPRPNIPAAVSAPAAQPATP